MMRVPHLFLLITITAVTLAQETTTVSTADNATDSLLTEPQGQMIAHDVAGEVIPPAMRAISKASAAEPSLGLHGITEQQLNLRYYNFICSSHFHLDCKVSRRGAANWDTESFRSLKLFKSAWRTATWQCWDFHWASNPGRLTWRHWGSGWDNAIGTIRIWIRRRCGSSGNAFISRMRTTGERGGALKLFVSRPKHLFSRDNVFKSAHLRTSTFLGIALLTAIILIWIRLKNEVLLTTHPYTFSIFPKISSPKMSCSRWEILRRGPHKSRRTHQFRPMSSVFSVSRIPIWWQFLIT